LASLVSASWPGGRRSYWREFLEEEPLTGRQSPRSYSSSLLLPRTTPHVQRYRPSKPLRDWLAESYYGPRRTAKWCAQRPWSLASHRVPGPPVQQKLLVRAPGCPGVLY